MKPFRQSAWSLSDALTDEQALADLEARPTSKIHARARDAFIVERDATPKRKVGNELLGAGFVYVGTTLERTTDWRGLQPSDTFVDADRTTFATVRRSLSFRTQILGLSRYFLVTLLADGTCIETVGRRKPIVASENQYVVRAGHDDLARDVAEHMTYVRERAMQGDKIVPVRTLDDVVQIKRLYVSHVIPKSTADTILHLRDNERWMSKGIAYALLALAAIAYLLSRL